MIIKNVKVFTEDKKFVDGEVVIENGKFCRTSTEDDNEVVDGKGCYAVPGLVDVHFHGAMGYDFCDASNEAISKIAEYEGSQGITTIVPATMTLPEDLLIKVAHTAAAYKNEKGAVLAGINMEGPFISPEKKGAQAATHIRKPDIEMFRRLQDAAGGLFRLVDIAPEEEGAMKFIEELKDEVHISFAHTVADYDTAKKGYDLGADHATHLYNAMPPFSHRAPGVIGAAHDSKHCMVELIADGVHIHPSVVRTTFDMFSDDRVVLISDSMRATGMPDGEYTLGGQAVNVKGNVATLVSGGALAGSVTNLMDCVRVAVKKMGVPLESALAAATINPAKSVGLDHKYGSIKEGKVANLVLLDQELNLKKVIING